MPEVKFKYIVTIGMRAGAPVKLSTYMSATEIKRAFLGVPATPEEEEFALLNGLDDMDVTSPHYFSRADIIWWILQDYSTRMVQPVGAQIQLAQQ